MWILERPVSLDALATRSSLPEPLLEGVLPTTAVVITTWSSGER